MRRPAALWIAGLLTTAARAADPTPVALKVGETVKLCKAGLTMCPVSGFLCDDPKVAVVEHGSDDVLLKGVAPGTTLCATLGSAGANRRVFRVTVHLAKP